MRRSLAPFSGPESSVHARSLADFITTTSGCRFSVHTMSCEEAFRVMTASCIFIYQRSLLQRVVRAHLQHFAQGTRAVSHYLISAA